MKYFTKSFLYYQQGNKSLIKGLKNKFETAVVYQPSESEPLKFYCIA